MSRIPPRTTRMIGQIRSRQAGDGEVRGADREQDRAERRLPAPARARCRAHRGDEQERDAEAGRPDARPVDDAGRGEQVGRRERGDDRAEVERAHPAVDEPRDEERDADREEQQRARGLERREQLPQEQQRAEHDEEDPEPRQPAARPARPGSRTTPSRTRGRRRPRSRRPSRARPAARSSVPPVVSVASA